MFAFIVAYVVERVELEEINIEVQGKDWVLISLNDFYICYINDTDLSMLNTIQLAVNLTCCGIYC